MRILIYCVVIGLFLSSGCAPVFSEMQSAKLVGKGEVEATGLYSNLVLSDDGESSHTQNQIGVRLSYGFSDKLNIRGGYENVFEDGNVVANVFGIGPKISIIKDKIAAYVPLGMAFGDEISTSDTWQIQPTALFTVPVSENIEINPSAKYLLFFDSDQDNLVALNFGAGLSTDLRKWVIRPEIGLLYDPGTSGHFTHYSIGFTFFPLFEDPCCPQKLRRNR